MCNCYWRIVLSGLFIELLPCALCLLIALYFYGGGLAAWFVMCGLLLLHCSCALAFAIMQAKLIGLCSRLDFVYWFVRVMCLWCKCVIPCVFFLYRVRFLLRVLAVLLWYRVSCVSLGVHVILAIRVVSRCVLLLLFAVLTLSATVALPEQCLRVCLFTCMFCFALPSGDRAVVFLIAYNLYYWRVLSCLCPLSRLCLLV